MKNIIHIYLIGNNINLENHLPHLPNQEQHHLTQLTSQVSQQNYLLSRSLLRQLLSPLLSLPPHKINFEKTPSKKPILAPTYGLTNLHFNISHCPGAILIGLHEKPIGVDLENINRPCSFLKLAKRHFTPEEYQDCKRHNSIHYFLQLWTLKEAYAKSMGQGIYASFKSFTVQNTHTSNPSIKNKKNQVTLQSHTLDNYIIGLAIQHPKAHPLPIVNHTLK
ncbi:MAG TPA: 4'-phosphopantetheinyl transferase superfamily protein [Gammaproteobacteria bacterium]|nr:4'-phosphopantetheinyl transferase superfamily protein [Gammaproteobacteria bacterium]